MTLRKSRRTSLTLQEALNSITFVCRCADYCQCGAQLDLDDVITLLKRYNINLDSPLPEADAH